MLFFIHIPKAAGTSLRAMLETKLGEKLIHIYENQPGKSVTDALSQTLPEDALLYGHFAYGLHRRFAAAPRYATVFRHPVRRVVSLYNFQAQHQNLPMHDAATQFSLPELLEQEKSDQISNHMTKILTGRNVRSIDDRETLKAAKENLKSFEFISTQETLEADMKRLGDYLGIALAPLSSVNKSLPRADENEVWDEVLKYNKLDLELYEYALDLRENASFH